MASTVVEFNLPEEAAASRAVLSATVSGQVAPVAGGYVATPSVSTPWRYTLIVPEACVGIYRIEVQNSDGVIVGLGWVWIKSDDTNTYISSGDHAGLLASQSADALLKTIDTKVEPSAIRGAVGLASANIDTQFTGLVNATTASAIRAAMGLAAASIDSQLSALSAVGVANGASLSTIDGIVDAILVDTGTTLPATLALIESRTQLFGTGLAVVTSPVADNGDIKEIVIGDDYSSDNTNRSFDFTVDNPGNIADSALAVCRFGGRHRTDKTNRWLVTGTASDVGSGKLKLSFDLPSEATAALKDGDYLWSVEMEDDSGNIITKVKNSLQGITRLVYRQTV